MANEGGGAGKAAGTEAEPTMVEPSVKEAEGVAEAEAAVEEVEVATATTIIGGRGQDNYNGGRGGRGYYNGYQNNPYQGNQQQIQSHFQQQMPTTISLPHSAGSTILHFQSHHIDSYANQTGNNPNNGQWGYQRPYWS